MLQYLSYLTLPYLTLPYLTLPYLILSYLILSYLILSYLLTSFDYVKFAMSFNLRLTSHHWWIVSTQPGNIVCTIIKGLSHSTATAEQWDNAAPHLYHHGSCDALTCPN